MSKLAHCLPDANIYVLYQRAYTFWKKLKDQKSDAAKRRAQCALWIGDFLYNFRTADARSTEIST
jgi:hypothetical protein